jgi:hypothetical protein
VRKRVSALRPSAKPARNPARADDEVLQWVSGPEPRTLDDLRPRTPLPPGESGFARIFGKWPGDESDEEVALALEELS